MNFVVENYEIEYNKDDITYTNVKTGCSNTITKGQYELSLLRSSPCQAYFNGIPIWLMQRIQMKVKGGGCSASFYLFLFICFFHNIC